MESCECFCKAAGRIIAVFHCDIDDFHIGGSDIPAGQRQSAVPDIFCYGIAAEHMKALLKIKGRDMHMVCHIFYGYVLGNMLLHKFDCALHGICPFHVNSLLTRHVLPETLCTCLCS